MSKNEIGYSACYSFDIDDGPCNFDEQCKETLICGYKNCPPSFDENHNCCTKNELLKSPNYPMNYPPYVEKNWLITASFGSIINLQFQSFQVRLSSAVREAGFLDNICVDNIHLDFINLDNI